MRLYLLLKTAFGALSAHRGRSALTVLGIVIGISAIILILSLGDGAQKLILNELGSFGPNLLVIRPGREPSGPSDLTQTIFSDSLKERDVEALKRKANVPDLADIAPGVVVPGSVSYEGETYRPQMFGWSAEFLSTMFDIIPRQGQNFTESDIAQNAAVAVIGEKVRRELFGSASALGKNIRIKGKNFRVVGVFAPKGQVAVFDVDDIVIVPYTTAQKYLLGIDYYNEIAVRIADADAAARAARDIEYTLRETHHITDPSKDDFYVVSAEGLLSQVGTILSALAAFLSSVVAISLVVGGIGVMNIMLVAVTERTREIGLRKAVGATDSDVLRQFLLEAMLLTAAGGIIGIALGVALSFLVSLVLGQVLGISWGFAFPVGGALMAVGVSVFVGLIFGIYPARRASRLNPIEALRYE